MLQQFAKAEAAESAQALCQFCREQQSSSEPLRWIAGANPPPLFFHEFPDSHRFPHYRYTPKLSKSAGKWGRVTKDFWQAACSGEPTRAEFDGQFGKVVQVGFALAVRCPEAGKRDGRTGLRAEAPRPLVLPTHAVVAVPDLFKRCALSQVVYVPVGTAGRFQVVREPSADASATEGAADIYVESGLER